MLFKMGQNFQRATFAFITNPCADLKRRRRPLLWHGVGGHMGHTSHPQGKAPPYKPPTPSETKLAHIPFGRGALRKTPLTHLGRRSCKAARGLFCERGPVETPLRQPPWRSQPPIPRKNAALDSTIRPPPPQNAQFIPFRIVARGVG
ncbi:hypothetical protein DQ04_08251040 [Trypanosoma grayi]|uniref:hypothetical protein n=1 Tax=Trypanosoma grayi TaxID=71804 RepID=UPI0004F422E0|nr:hypothetical protein DQ04_08251040 [Trypanosoma grayi]KEG07999.1 hypothetical protein DQ04_08251040 [Trypanosoma grayi]